MRFSLCLSKLRDPDNETVVVGSEFYTYELVVVLIRVLVQMRDGDSLTIKAWEN